MKRILCLAESVFYDANPNMVITGKKGSFAEMYAKKNNFRFIPYDNLPLEKLNSAYGLYKNSEN